MNVNWVNSKYFKQPFIQIGWDLTQITKFPRCKYLSADTETKIYYNNKLLSEDEAHILYTTQGAKWCRENIEVRAYAYMLSDGDNFALFQNAEDFLTCCSTMLVDKVFWYNARFDFAIFDYYFATNGWKQSDESISEQKKNKHYGHLGDKNYQSLNGDYGQRYQMRIWKSYKNRYAKVKVHNFKMLDICNIFPGGLRKNLIDWKIQDKEGNEVRKLTMDYVNASVENDIDYMVADTKGLHLLAVKVEEAIKEISGFSLFNGDYMTAGGLAKKSLLKFMFGCEKVSDNLKLFHNYFPMSVEEDKEMRELHLYQGGKCFVNPYKCGKPQFNIYKYDVNSMYPAQMHKMLYPCGKPHRMENLPVKLENNKVYVICVSHMIGKLKENKVPVWYDTLTNEYVAKIYEPDKRLIWLEELEEYKLWYDMLYKVEYVLEYDAYKCKGTTSYVDNYYKLKCNSSGSIKRGAKLFLNSAYGKLAQRIERVKCTYELCDEGYIHLVKGESEIDENNMMSVLVGSRITALARVCLMTYIREICGINSIKQNFIYCDTDSVHALTPYADTDDTELGKMKCEGVYEWGKYLAPKTYLLYNKGEGFEVHTKGVNTNVVLKELEKCDNLSQVSQKFSSGVVYKCLTSLNVKGGKALIYIDKMLLNPKLDKSLEDDELIEGLLD